MAKLTGAALSPVCRYTRMAPLSLLHNGQPTTTLCRLKGREKEIENDAVNIIDYPFAFLKSITAKSIPKYVSAWERDKAFL